MKGVCINQNDKRARVHIDQDVIDGLHDIVVPQKKDRKAFQF